MSQKGVDGNSVLTGLVQDNHSIALASCGTNNYQNKAETRGTEFIMLNY